MIQVIQRERKEQKPNFAQQFASSLQTGIQNYKGYQQEKAAVELQKQQKEQQVQNYQEENEAVKRLIGKDITGIRDPKIRQSYIDMALQAETKKTEQERQFAHDIEKQTQQQYFEGQQEKFKNENKPTPKEEIEKAQNVSNLNSALDTVGKMRQLRKKGNLGRGSAVTGFFGGETAKDRGEYETLGNSLIQYASNIPIRNKAEFEKLAGHLGDPSITDDQAEGILNAMERIIQNSMQQYQGNENVQMRGPSPSSKPSQTGKPENKQSLQDIFG